MNVRIHSVVAAKYMDSQRVLGDHLYAAMSFLPEEKAPLLVQSRFGHSVALASRFYNLMSVASGHSGFHHFPRIVLAPDHVANALAKAGPGMLPGAVQSLVLSGGRDLITQTVTVDPAAEGWDWLAEPGACDYCQGKAGDGGDSSFEAHYGCGCIAAPRFRNGNGKELLIMGDYNTAQRDALRKRGAAMAKPGGGRGGRYPIADRADLHKAILAVGRGSGSHGAIRAYIKKRAAALGATSMIPDTWK